MQDLVYILAFLVLLYSGMSLNKYLKFTSKENIVEYQQQRLDKAKEINEAAVLPGKIFALAFILFQVVLAAYVAINI